MRAEAGIKAYGVGAGSPDPPIVHAGHATSVEGAGVPVSPLTACLTIVNVITLPPGAPWGCAIDRS